MHLILNVLVALIFKYTPREKISKKQKICIQWMVIFI